jgi:hypothetical protein
MERNQSIQSTLAELNEHVRVQRAETERKELILSTTSEFNDYVCHQQANEAIELGRFALRFGLLDTKPQSAHGITIHHLVNITGKKHLKPLLNMLIKSGSDINHRSPEQCYTLLTRCIVVKNFELFKLLLAQRNIQINEPVSLNSHDNPMMTCGQTPLILILLFATGSAPFDDELLARYYELDFQHRDLYGKTVMDYMHESDTFLEDPHRSLIDPHRSLIAQKIRHTLNVVYPAYLSSIQQYLRDKCLILKELSTLIVSFVNSI